MHRGKEALHGLVEQWRCGGTPIDEIGRRREAFNIMLSMSHGTAPGIVQAAAREFARHELMGHRYVMVLHDHQANPRMHLSVKASSTHGTRLNPRKAELHCWRETFAEKLRGYGIEAEASRQATRGVTHNFDPIWRLKARNEARLRETKKDEKTGRPAALSRSEARSAWSRFADALASWDRAEDRHLASEIHGFVRRQPVAQRVMEQQRETAPAVRPAPQREIAPRRERQGPEIER